MSILPPLRSLDLPRLSVFVDADNIAASQASAILSLARRVGAPDLIRAYRNVSNLSEWDKVPGFHLIHSGSGKNATDMLICVDAMERALSRQCDAVLLVSSDQDFTHLATRLRGYGLTVIGAGEAKTVERFRAACSEFHLLACSKACFAELSPPEPSPQCAPLKKIDKRIYAVFEANSPDENGILISLLSSEMHKRFRAQISTYPEKTWRAYLKKRPALYDLDPKGPNAKVRCKPEAFKVAAN